MTDIYEQHQAAFKNVQAYVITLGNERIATVAFKRGNAITCYFHLFGLQMERGRAGGGGYDRNSAAFYDAANKVKVKDGARPEDAHRLELFKKAAKDGNGGSHWDRALREAGFNVWEAV